MSEGIICDICRMEIPYNCLGYRRGLRVKVMAIGDDKEPAWDADICDMCLEKIKKESRKDRIRREE